MPDFTLTLLHVSDLHDRGPREKDTWRRRRVLGDAWERNLDEIAAEGPLDLVCFTGDAAFSGKADEYARVTEFFGAMLERLELGWDRFFVVPGNHDIDRDLGEQVWEEWRKKLSLTSMPQVSPWLAGSGRAPQGFGSEDFGALLKRQEAYREWVTNGIRRPDLDPVASPHGQLGYRKTLRLSSRPFDLHVVGLDSAWMCGDNNDAGKLWLTDDQVMRLATKEGRPLEGFRLCLVHHPLDDVADGGYCRHLLANHVDLVLRGHLHDPELQTWEGPDRSLRQMAAGCLYEHDTYPNAYECIRITLDDKGRSPRYDLWFRKWSKQGCLWFSDNSLYRGTEDGWLRWKRDRPPEVEQTPRAGRIFVGREPELLMLEKSLLGDGETRPVAICAVQGMPGVGKSYLAERFVYLHRGQFPGGFYPLVLDPESAASPTVESLLSELADRLKLSQAPVGLADRVRGRLLLPKSLLEVENVDSEGLAGTVAGLIGALRGCPALVTGRYQGLGGSAGWGTVQVRPFDEKSALEQLAEELGPEGSREEKESYRLLVKTLGFLPLAVHLAAGHLRAGRSVRGFLERLRQSGWALPPADPADPVFTGKKTRALLASTFSLSLDLLRSQLGADGDRLLTGFYDLGHGPASGFGSSLGAAMVGLPDLDFEELAVAACSLSLLDPIPPSERRDRAFRVHPLLAELLRERSGEEGRQRTVDRMTEWFVARLPEFPYGQEEEQGKRWKEVQAEPEALTAWLPLVPEGDAVRVERAGSFFARLNGPFHVWASFCERLLTYQLKDAERSNVLWTLGRIALSLGEHERAALLAREKREIDRTLGAEREEALAAGLISDSYQVGGDFAEALRIRRDEVLPVYARLKDWRSWAGTMGKIADVYKELGDLEEALRIHLEEVLPTLELHPDERSRAMAKGRIADIYDARGDFEEALRLRREEQLPVLARLVDERELLVGRTKFALTYLKRKQPGDRETATDLLHLALQAAEEMRIPEAETIRSILQREGLPMSATSN